MILSGRGKKRNAPEDDHSSAEDASDQDDQDDTEDAPQDGHDNTDGAEDADDADADDADADDTDVDAVDTDADNAEDADDADDADNAPQDGLGNPNISSISPPLPADLVEPVLAEHETHFHVITTGNRSRHLHKQVRLSLSFCCFPPANSLSRGVADARLQCKYPSSVTFSTWALATAHYAECFVDDSVAIQRSLNPQSPINSPARKKRRLNLSLFESPYSPLLFPTTPPSLRKRIADRRNRSRSVSG
jgi:hypothetical protein